jgi:predicted pyridoxine 5'-phosphate oxidase superfamily flavin-nucleotide-binding protein
MHENSSQEAPLYHEGNREMQARFGSEALAVRLAETTHRTTFSPSDKELIECSEFFFLATADANGAPDCSFKGGAPGFVRVIAPDLLVYPDYDGNGMFKSVGNLRANPKVGMLFISMGEKPKRLRVNGIAELSFNDPLLGEFPGAQLLIRVKPRHVFPNCPRYIPHLQQVASSVYVPQAGCPPVEPAWKSFPEFRNVVPPRVQTA